jgi:hypothetical protein
MAQTILSFKLEKTDETISAHAGLALLGEYMRGLRVEEHLDRALPAPGSGAGYKPSQFVLPLLLMLNGGGRSLEDLRQIRSDEGLKRLLELDDMPSSDATGDWLKRMGEGKGLLGLAGVNRGLLKRALKHDGIKEYTLDIDATQIIAEKDEAKWTYKGERGYMPIVGHLAENGLVVGDEFREGNESPGSRNLEFVKHSRRQMPKGKRIKNLRADSASYQASIFNYCEEKGIKFAIGADLDEGVQKSIGTIKADKWEAYGDGQIAETIHSMNKTDKAFRLIVIRHATQGEMFGETRYRYTVIGSNRRENAKETVKWYNQRGEASENRIKELKIGFGMERMPCGTMKANAVFFRIGVMAYNVFVMFKRSTLPAEWRRQQVQTVRWRLYQTAGKVVEHARQLMLKVSGTAFSLFEEVRTRCAEFFWISPSPA